jgi:hypothetical protein
MNIESNWRGIRHVFRQAFISTHHYSMATVSPDGRPHVTPIGSVLLREPGHAIYFEKFTQHMTKNLDNNPNVCVLAVHSGFLFWILAIIRGRFNAPPAIRLHGTVGPPRNATDQEVSLLQSRVHRFRRTKGHQLMWANLHIVRDITFTQIDGVHIGEMTRQCWTAFSFQ